MNNFVEILIFCIVGTALLWFGYTLFFGVGLSAFGFKFRKNRGFKSKTGTPGDPQTCPVCSTKLRNNELVKSAAFPSINGGQDRLMHIRGCLYCLVGDQERFCPVCGIILDGNEILICRLFERPGRRSHVHVLGCTQCRGFKA